jgi:hypothetical protein
MFEMVKNLMDIGTKKDFKEIYLQTTKERGAGTQRTRKMGEKDRQTKRKKHKNNNSSLYCEKLYKNSNTMAVSFNMPILPEINDQKIENIKFRRGETERILMNEYYRNCYNSSIQVSKFNSDFDTNVALRKNYSRLWESVNDYKDKLSSKK